MSQRVIQLTCPGCGAPVAPNATKCEFCEQPIIVTSFNSIAKMTAQMVNKYANSYSTALKSAPDDKLLNVSVAMCYLKLKLYDKALQAFEKAIENDIDNSEAYFYAGVCLLKGKKAFLAPRSSIDKIEEYINAANLLEERGIYHYFWGYIKQDYFERKFLNTTPSWKECLSTAEQIGVSEYDKSNLFDLLGVQRPQGF